jgi:hypothetical protein
MQRESSPSSVAESYLDKLPAFGAKPSACRAKVFPLLLLVSCERFSTVEGTQYIRRATTPLRTAALLVIGVLALALSACGGGENQAKDAPSGTFKATIVDWKFAEHQPLGTPQDFSVKIRNDDSRAIPQLVLTVSGLRMTVHQPGAASDVRPIWLPKVDQFATVTPYNSPLAVSYNLGKLEPGATRTYTFNLTPLRRGSHEVGIRIAPALVGSSKIVNASDGKPAEETRTVVIDPTPVMDETTFDN